MCQRSLRGNQVVLLLFCDIPETVRYAQYSA
jgi:hypothetical protein